MVFNNNNIVDALIIIQIMFKLIINGSNIVCSLGFLIKLIIVATCTSSHQKIIMQVIIRPIIINNELCVKFDMLNTLLINQIYHHH